jgi:hypothetical protein
MGKKSGSGINIPDNFFDSLKQFLGEPPPPQRSYRDALLGAQPAMSLRDRCRRPKPGCRRRWRRARASTSGEAPCRRLRRCTRGPTRSWSGVRKFSGCRWATEKRRCRWTASSRTRGRNQCSRRRRRSEVGRQGRPPHPPLPPSDDSAEGGPVETSYL